MSKLSVMDGVATIVSRYPDVNDITEFVMLYWKEIDNVKCLDDILDATSSESIARTRRRLLKREAYKQ